jgi:hypothetical protein
MRRHGREFWEKAADKARRTHKMSISRVKARLTSMGWECCTFQTKRKNPKKGIVDLVALRRSKANRDRLQVVLFQVKGGSARFPDEKDRTRLQRAPGMLEVGYDYVMYKKGKPIWFWIEPSEFPGEFLSKVELRRPSE